MTDLVGIHAKLRRAKDQIGEITNESQGLCAEVAKAITREVCEDANKQVWIYRGETPNTPIEWSVILGEILYDLRSSLDHLVWQLVLANGQTPGRHNEFLITTDHQSWQQTKGRALKGVSKRHEAMIGYLQPYTGGMNLPFDVSMLKILNDLGNTEKHRHLILGVLVSKGIEPLDSQLDDSSTRPPLRGSFMTGRIETGKVLLELNNADMDIVPSFEVDVGLANIGLPGWTLLHILDKCLRTVKGCVEFLTTPMGHGFVEASKRP